MADDNSTESEPLLEASARAPSRRALKISGGATVLALCLLGVVASRTRTPGPKPNLAPIDTTSWIDVLNNQMAQSPTFNDDKDANVYSGGDNYGVIVRALDDGMTVNWVPFGGGPYAPPPASGRCKNVNQDDIPCLAVGTFWHNDIMAVSQFYPHDPWCPHGESFHPCGGIPGVNDASWRMPNLGIVVGTWMDTLLEASGMGTKKDDFPNIQTWGTPTGSWGFGTFYAHDSNAQDIRCIFIEDASGCFYDCPKGFLTASCPGVDPPDPWVWYDDLSKMGAGAYPAGVYGGEAGGAGCHYDSHSISQVGMESYVIASDIESLTGDANCQCNYVYNDDWGHWVDVMYQYLQQTQYEAYGQAGMSWVQDEAACWLNNFHDLIRLQNQLYWKRSLYLDNNVPFSSFDFVNDGEAARKYWGWNEIPFTAGDKDTDTAGINNPQYWDAVFIWLPAFTCGVDLADNVYIWDEMQCVDQEGIDFLESKIQNYVDSGALVPGFENMQYRPGSSVAIVRQIPEFDWDLSSWTEETGWTKQFYCESWDLNNYKIVYDQANDGCYVDYK